MEPNNTSSILGEQLTVSPDVNYQLTETSRWTRIACIISIVFLAILLLILVVAGSALTTVLGNFLPAGGDMLTGIFFVFIGIVFLVCGVLIYLLLRFSKLTSLGLRTQNQAVFNDGLAALKTYFIIYGVLSIVLISFSLVPLLTIF
jgi:hypothetical protein